MNQKASSPRIYVACLSAYNNGKLHGVWIDLDDVYDTEELLETIQARVLDTSPDPGEEWAIHDNEGFEGFKVGEHPDLEDLMSIKEVFEEHEFVARAASYNYHRVEEVIEACNECFYGVYEDMEDFGRNLLEDNDAIPRKLEDYIDYERYGEDSARDMVAVEFEGMLYVFHNH